MLENELAFAEFSIQWPANLRPSIHPFLNFLEHLIIKIYFSQSQYFALTAGVRQNWGNGGNVS